MSVLFENKVNFKIFQSLKDLKKYVKIVNTTEQILYECPIFLKIRDTETNSKIKFLRLYETFMLISKYYFFYLSIFRNSLLQCKSFDQFKIASYGYNISVNFKCSKIEASSSVKLLRSFVLISNEQTLQFFNTNDLDVYNIFQVLKTKLIFQGFHDHFKAVKKIGRGNFASVTKLKNPSNIKISRFI